MAGNGREALIAEVRRERPDLIVLDVMMPEMNGFDVAAVLKNDPQTHRHPDRHPVDRPGPRARVPARRRSLPDQADRHRAAVPGGRHPDRAEDVAQARAGRRRRRVDGEDAGRRADGARLQRDRGARRGSARAGRGAAARHHHAELGVVGRARRRADRCGSRRGWRTCCSSSTSKEPAVTQTILIVDDEAHLRMLLQQTLEELEDEGVELLTATNGEEALAAIESAKPNLVFLDVMMPKLSGFDVCDRAKQDARPHRRLHRAAHGQGPGVRSAARAGGRRRPVHDQAVRSGRAPAEGARRARHCTDPVMSRVALKQMSLARQRTAPGAARSDAHRRPRSAIAGTIEDADGRLLHGDAPQAPRRHARAGARTTTTSLGWVRGRTARRRGRRRCSITSWHAKPSGRRSAPKCCTSTARST